MSRTAQVFHLIFIHLVDSRFAHWDDKAESNDDKNNNETINHKSDFNQIFRVSQNQ